MTANVCTGVGFTVTPVDGTNGIVPAGTTYSWGVPVVTGGLTGGAASSGAPVNITGNLTNSTFTAQTATYTVTPTSGTCVGTPFSVIVTVNPTPVINPMSTVVCGDGVFTVTPTDVTNGRVPAGTTYTWPAPVVTGGLTGGAASSGNPTSITGTLTNPTITTQTATYTVTPTSGSCAGTSFLVTVTVNPSPAVTAMTASVCNGAGFTVTPVDGTNGIVPAGTTYTWLPPVVTGGLTGGAASVGTPSNITGTLTNPTNVSQTATYTVTPTSGGCQGETFTLTITVYGNLTASINLASTSICYNTTPGILTATGSGGTGSYSYLWYMDGSPTGATSPNFAPGALTTTSTFYCAVTSGSCGTVNTPITTITVRGPLTAGGIESAQSICPNTAPATLTSTAVGTGSGAISYAWESSTNGVLWTRITGAVGPDYSPGTLITTTQFHRITVSTIAGTTCESAATSPVVITVSP
jgi:hypothetical protein